MDSVDEVFEWNDITQLDKAYAIAKDAHSGQLRDEGTPYITHIDGVLEVLRNELKVKSDMVLAVAAMHDVLEDSNKYSAADLTKYFGEDISKAVQLLTKKKGQDVQDYLKEIDESEYASWLMIVKLADRLNNIRCLAYINDPEKKARKCEETRQYFMEYTKKYSDYVYTELEKALKSVGS